MRDPINLKFPLIDNKEIEIIEIINPRPFDIDDYDLSEEKDFARFIFDIERTCRRSYEYRELIKFLKENMDFNQCGIYENTQGVAGIKIEVHHEPFTLYDIATIVVQKRTNLGESLDIELVCKEVMHNHYALLVGLYPTTKTVHKLVHNEYIFLPLDKIFGNVDGFVEKYKDHISIEMKECYSNIKKYSTIYDGKDLSILNKKYIYVDTGQNIEEGLNDLGNYLKSNIDNIKSRIYERDNIITPIYWIE